MDTATARKLAKLAFPGWRGRKLRVKETPEVGLYGTYWDGGSKNEFVAVELATGRVAPSHAALSIPREFGGLGGSHRLVIPEGVAVVEHSIFCGKDVGCTVYVRPEKTLEAGVPRA